MRAGTEQLANRIDATLTNGNVPAQYRRWGEHLARHLRRPVRVLLTGAEGAGKSRLVGLLNSDPIGTQQPHPAMACTTAPLPQDVAAFLHLVKGVDMVIWCSQEFSANEHRIWATAPQTLHDHSFLVLTSDRAEVRHTLVNGLFRAVHRVDLRGASSTISTKNERLWQASGLTDLQSALLQQVDQGIEADVDHAQAFLVQFEKTQAQEARRPVIAPRDNTHRIRRALQEADHLLAACGDDLNRRATRQVLTPPEILSCCADTARALQDMLTKEKTIRPEIRKLVAEGEKAIRSLVDSTATTATLDAITVLLQMRREIGTGADSAA